MGNHGMDEKDEQIIRLLRRDARMTYSEIGEQIGLSRTAVKTRVSALEKSGVIKGYHAAVDPLATDGMTAFVVNIETEPGHFDEAKALFAQAPETLTLVQTTGNCHLLAICVSENIQTMRTFVNRIYRTAPGILSINAHSVLDVLKGSVIPE